MAERMPRKTSRQHFSAAAQVVRVFTARGVPGMHWDAKHRTLNGFAPRVVIRTTSGRSATTWRHLPERISEWERETGKNHAVIIASASYGAPENSRVLMDLDLFAEMAADLAQCMPDKWLTRKREN